jgi:hypothetical protein
MRNNDVPWVELYDALDAFYNPSRGGFAEELVLWKSS